MQKIEIGGAGGREDGDVTEINRVEFVLVKSGEFMMGSPENENGRWDDETQHLVTLTQDYYIGKYEVTNTQYADFLNAMCIGGNGIYNGNILIYESNLWGSPYDWGLSHVDGSWRPVSGYENHPVVFVTWYGANEFCKWVGGRLPTEAEWEFAARGGNKSNGYIYSGNNNLNEICWYWENSSNSTHPVEKKQSNELGICDMSGNVWEWCSDWWDTYSTIAETNPTGPVAGDVRVIRGGCWSSFARYCRVANRSNDYSSCSYHALGFRVVFPRN